MMYRLTKGSVAIIRADAAGVKAAQAAGYTLAGECDAEGNLTRPLTELPAKAPKAKG